MDKTWKTVSNQLRIPITHLTATEENELFTRNQFHLIFLFSGLWFSYCWWLSEQYHFNFGEYTIIFRLVFCIIHVLTVWKFFHYIIKFTFRLYQFSRQLRTILIEYITMIVLTFVLFVLLTFVLNFKEFLRKAFAITD